MELDGSTELFNLAHRALGLDLPLYKKIWHRKIKIVAGNYRRCMSKYCINIFILLAITAL